MKITFLPTYRPRCSFSLISLILHFFLFIVILLRVGPFVPFIGFIFLTV